MKLLFFKVISIYKEIGFKLHGISILLVILSHIHDNLGTNILPR